MSSLFTGKGGILRQVERMESEVSFLHYFLVLYLEAAYDEVSESSLFTFVLVALQNPDNCINKIFNKASP